MSFDKARQVSKWAAEECHKQRSGELSVGWMIEGWAYAREVVGPTEARMPTMEDAYKLTRIVDPKCRDLDSRTWSILFNWMNGTLELPVPLPDDWTVSGLLAQLEAS